MSELENGSEVRDLIVGLAQEILAYNPLDPEPWDNYWDEELRRAATTGGEQFVRDVLDVAADDEATSDLDDYDANARDRAWAGAIASALSEGYEKSPQYAQLAVLPKLQDSALRPFVLQSLATNQPWPEGFSRAAESELRKIIQDPEVLSGLTEREKMMAGTALADLAPSCPTALHLLDHLAGMVVGETQVFIQQALERAKKSQTTP